VTAYIAKHAELKNALIMGILSLVSGLFCITSQYLLSAYSSTNSIVYPLITAILTIPAALAGAYIRILLKDNRPPTLIPPP
jgi:hypothetical protein